MSYLYIKSELANISDLLFHEFGFTLPTYESGNNVSSGLFINVKNGIEYLNCFFDNNLSLFETKPVEWDSCTLKLKPSSTNCIYVSFEGNVFSELDGNPPEERSLILGKVYTNKKEIELIEEPYRSYKL